MPDFRIPSLMSFVTFRITFLPFNTKIETINLAAEQIGLRLLFYFFNRNHFNREPLLSTNAIFLLSPICSLHILKQINAPPPPRKIFFCFLTHL